MSCMFVRLCEFVTGIYFCLSLSVICYQVIGLVNMCVYTYVSHKSRKQSMAKIIMILFLYLAAKSLIKFSYFGQFRVYLAFELGDNFMGGPNKPMFLILIF